MRVKVLFLLFILFFTQPAFTQKRTLQQIEAQIKKLEAELKRKESSEKTILSQLDDLNREIGLSKALLSTLEKELIKSRREIVYTENKLDNTKKEYERLKGLVRERIISMYKRGRWSDWEVFFSFSSFNQALVWLKYQKIIAENDKRNLRLLKQKGAQIESHSKKLKEELARKKKLVRKRENETALLIKKQQERKKLLSKVRQDKKLIAKRLAQKKSAYKGILKRIKAEEAKRKTAPLSIASTGFGAKKGVLPWPVKGRVVAKYGRHLQPVLKTWIENIGIDIKGTEGSFVKAVNRGVVKWVTWQRGMENIVLLYHGDGYYTVYGHLEIVLVTTGETVNQGDIIGSIGDKQSLEGPVLHFEVWKGANHFNPEKWLTKR